MDAWRRPLKWLLLTPGLVLGALAGVWILIFAFGALGRAFFDVPASSEVSVAALPDGFAADLTGRVSEVQDGDSLILFADDRSHRVRLQGIDAPEYNQPWGRQARRALIRKVRGKTVSVDVSTFDRYDRLVADVRLGDRDIGRELVSEGHAWVYRRFSSDPRLLREESAARQKKLGLWRDDDPVPPWEWRER